MKTSTRILTIALAIAFWPTSTAGQDMADFAEGARLYGQHCIRCHTARSPTERSDRDWVTIVNHMRARANLPRSQALALSTFLQTTNMPETAVTAAAAPAAPTSATARMEIRDATGEELLVVLDLSDPRLPAATRAALERYLDMIRVIDPN